MNGDRGRQADGRDDVWSTSNPRIPVIAMTASTMRGDRDKCIQARMSYFIAKPVQQRELAEMLARWLAITINPRESSDPPRQPAIPISN